MKKEDITSIIVYAIILLTAILTYWFGVRPAFEDTIISGNQPIIISLCSFIGALLVAEIIMELGHVIGAKIGKYSIVSVNMFGFNFYKTKEGKTKFRFKSFDGLMGETVVMPKKSDVDNTYLSKPKAMLSWPNVLLALLSVGCIVGILFTHQHSQLPAFYAFPVLTIGLLVFVLVMFYNIIPFKLDSLTDGYQLKVISKPENIQAFNQLQYVKSCNILGIEDENIKTFDEITDYTYEINLVSYYAFLRIEDYESAFKLIDKMVENVDNLNDANRVGLLAEKLYLLLLTDQIQAGKEFYNDRFTSEDKKILSNLSTLQLIRSFILVVGLLDDSESEVQYATSRANSAYKKVETGRQEMEKTLYKNALTKVKEKHPSWTLILKDPKKVKEVKESSQAKQEEKIDETKTNKAKVVKEKETVVEKDDDDE